MRMSFSRSVSGASANWVQSAQSTAFFEAFALEFTRAFHGNLLKIGHMGLALFRTRGFFAMKHDDPPGSFCTVYANPNLRVSGRILPTCESGRRRLDFVGPANHHVPTRMSKGLPAVERRAAPRREVD